MSTPINYKTAPSADAAPTPAQRDQLRNDLYAQLLPQAHVLLADLFGETQISGDEITMRNPRRDDDDLGSFKFNTKNGAWSDFAVEDFKGYGITMLYANVKGMTISAAIEALTAWTGTRPIAEAPALAALKPEKPKVEAVNPLEVMLPPDFHPNLGFPTRTWEYRDADNKLSFYVYRFDHDGKKETRPVSWAPEKNEWRWQYPALPFLPYHLPELLAHPQATVVVTEGEKAADAAAAQFPDVVTITSARGADQALHTDWAALKGRNVIIAPDKDGPGKHYALSVAGAALAQGASSVRVIDVWQLSDWEAGDDLADHTVSAEFLDTAVDVFTLCEQTEVEPHLVKASAGLSKGDFDRAKVSLAKGLGIGTRTFEGLVKEARIKDQDDAGPENATAIFADDALEPWGEVVDGSKLFNEIFELINRYVILTVSQAVAVACWIIFSYGFDAMRICPQLLINSPSKRCGKSTLMELIMSLVPRPLPAANITPAAVFRSIESWKPTLLIDEADTFLNRSGNEEMTGILNSGHNRTMAIVVRTQEVDGNHEPVSFSTFCPKVIAMIKAPADTIIDRSIVITLVRKLAGERVEALAIDAAERMKDTRRRILRWQSDNLAEVKYDVEAIPLIGNDRARQNWAVLAAFSKVLGNKPHAMLLQAVTDLSDTSGIEENLETDLLADIRELMASHKGDFIQSGVLISGLLKLTERPWSELNHGKPLNANRLSRMLKPFELLPTKFRDGAATPRGYSIAALSAVMDRYLGISAGGVA